MGEDFTRKMSDAHEYSTPANEVDLDLIMDIHNNDVGIQAGRENPNATPTGAAHSVAELRRRFESRG